MLSTIFGIISDNSSSYHMFVTYTLFAHAFVFWPLSLMFMAIDLLKQPRFLYKHKIQKNQEHDWPEYKKAIKQALISQITGVLFASAVFYLCDFFGWGLDMGKELPSFYRVAFRLVGFFIIEEIAFFYLHRMFHSKRLYKPIHSVHHEFTSPVGMAAIYAHPIEHIVVNLFPLLLGPILFHAHVIELWFWICIGTVDTINSHSGYKIPSTSSSFHDFHHESFKYNFGVFGTLDMIHNTYRRRSSIRDW